MKLCGRASPGSTLYRRSGTVYLYYDHQSGACAGRRKEPLKNDGSNTSIRTKTRHPADFFTYVAIYVCAILSGAASRNHCMYLSKVSGALTGNSLPVSLRC